MSIKCRFVDSLASVTPAAWDQLALRDNPFLSHAFLYGLEQTGCLGGQSGWYPNHLLAESNGQLLAAAPCYVKTNSMGEYVFDWAWADAYQRNGQNYYPKLLTAVPYSPVIGPRLLVSKNAGQVNGLQQHMLEAKTEYCNQQGLSSWHINFPEAAEYHIYKDIRCDTLERFDWQFHWYNRDFECFADFLASLNHKKRKNIRQERSAIARAGIECDMQTAGESTEAELDFAVRCYQRTFMNKGNPPMLKRRFFLHLANAMPDQLLISLARQDGQLIAAAIFLRGGDRLYGRYWGCMVQIPALHFELCYYQGIDYCIRHRLAAFEPGAQGEHKIPRGFQPTRTRSLHYIQDPVYRKAIGDYLEQEADWLESYHLRLQDRLPFRHVKP